MIRVAIEHRTSYRFDRRVHLGPHVIRLRPAPHCRTPVLAYSLRVTPEQHFLNWQQDPFGNYLARVVFPEPSDHLEIVVDLVADMTVYNPFDFFVEEAAQSYPFVYDAQLAVDLAPYLRPEAPGPLLSEWMAEATAGGRLEGKPINDFLVELNQQVQRDVAYTVRMEPGVTTPEQTLAKRLGSCRDSAWLLVQILRQLGLASRFVSGYLVQLAPDAPPLEGPAGPSADFTDLHAWAEVYIPGAGWLGLDATSGLFAGEGHLPLVCSPDPSSAAPVTGALEPCEVTFEHTNVVRRLHEDPRVTKPYSAEQWERIDALGHAVDADLAAADVRLTVGGEPTFVSIDDMDGPEWNFTADSAEKRALAWELTGRLGERFAPGGLVQVGQGKWYPGEPLPRWQIAVYWRTDGEPIWSHPHLLGGPADSRPEDENETGPEADRRPETGSTPDTDHDARRLAVAIAAGLGIGSEFCLPAYEDPIRLLWDHATLPPGLPPAGDERAALVAHLDEQRGEAAGWVVPVHRRTEPGEAWGTSRWTTRRGHLFLVPGDSPMALRLPLSSLVWAPRLPDPPLSPFAPRPPLGLVGRAAVPPATVVRPSEATTTALCTEVRHGQLHVFLPPVDELEHWLELMAAVESAVVEHGRPVTIEGYPPPGDPRLRQLGVAPDPGVIEVNVHPTASWREMVETLSGLYDDARQTRLGTEKFALDGTHTGTGGGNHMTLGGATPADSPILRRPDLLRSLITYWQHHPALSYLFAGQFIGPTSQAPRIDEARHDSLDELEIAFSELDRLADSARPWLLDRLLRHLLVDVSGNTHRAEFCIDKLFSPDGERGRLGLLELRAFEMPPHPRMALVQALLVRALVARFWHTPYRGNPVRWGTELHDRFLLPWYVQDDINDVVSDLADHGYPFDPSWLDPFLEFRFPRLGAVQVGPVSIELRAGIEPWPVLGEESGATGTSRGVDSSMERLQILVEGMTGDRHLIACNGTVIALHPTGVPGQAVAGVRYKAWKPPSSLHPTIDVDTPLVFDLVDTWNSRSLGGCTYHVSHPGGRSYETRPVNANEAEARRTSRFEPIGHTPGPMAEMPGVPSGLPGHGYARTVDLRRSRPTLT